MKSKARFASKHQPYIPTVTPKEFKLVLFGSGGVGKSAITIQFIRKEFVEEYDPTIEDSYNKTLFVDGAEAELEILDTAGQEEYSSMRDQYIRNGHGFMVIFSIDNRSSFDEANSILKLIMQVKDKPFVPIVVVANKCDLADKRVISSTEGQELARYWQAAYIETSAKMGVHIPDGFEELVRSVRRLRYGLPSSNLTHHSNTSTQSSESTTPLHNDEKSQFKKSNHNPPPDEVDLLKCCIIS